MVKYIYYEPKTGVAYDHEPRERNVYRLPNSKYVRSTLRGSRSRPNTTAEFIEWLELQEGLAKTIDEIATVVKG
jgi:hypothetical protein